MEEYKIKTITGKIADKNNCRLVDGKYYLIGDKNIENSGDIYEINNRFIRFETGRLIFNLTSNSYELISSSQAIKGIVNIIDNEFIYGYFIYNVLYDNILFDKNNTKHIVHRNCQIPLQYREEVSSGHYYDISLISTNKLIKVKYVSKDLKESFSYDSKNIMESYQKVFEMNYQPDYLNITSSLTSIVNDLSFGLEFETVAGIIPNYKLNSLPLIPLRDGSIRGLEYATLPLQGKLGIQALIDSVKELKKRTEYDESCSLHLHIGNIPRTKEFILAFYKFYSIFSEEIFSMFPLYKTENYNVKKKNYCKPYDFIKLNSLMDNKITDEKSLNENFSILFDYLAEVTRFSDYNNDLKNVDLHPRDSNDNAKWNITKRYHVVNFIPIIFGNKKTIEFRIHTPTYDLHKIINFILINSMLINYVKENQSSILADYKKTVYSFKNLETFMSIYFKDVKYDNCPQRDNIIDNLYEYTRNRKQYIYNDISKGTINTKEDDIHTHQYLDFTTTEEDNKKFHESLSKGYDKYGYQDSDSSYNDYRPLTLSSAGIRDRYTSVVDSDGRISLKKVETTTGDINQYLEEIKTMPSTPSKSYYNGNSNDLTWMDPVDQELEKKRAEIAQKLQDAALEVSKSRSGNTRKSKRVGGSLSFDGSYGATYSAPNIYMSSEQAKAFDDAARALFNEPTQSKQDKAFDEAIIDSIKKDSEWL